MRFERTDQTRTPQLVVSESTPAEDAIITSGPLREVRR